jgi:hypothetical protein
VALGTAHGRLFKHHQTNRALGHVLALLQSRSFDQHLRCFPDGLSFRLTYGVTKLVKSKDANFVNFPWEMSNCILDLLHFGGKDFVPPR